MIADINLAKEAAIKAGKIILRYYKADYQIEQKGYQNPVTTADKKADETIKKILMTARPEYGWLSEETKDSSIRLNKRFVWIVDPIDGTKEFINGIPEFVVSIALVEYGEPIIGVIYNPVKKEIFVAAKNMGSFFNETKIECTSKEKISEMTILNSRSELKRGDWNDYIEIFGNMKPVGSVAYKLALTSAGKADVFISLRPKNEWDICAGNCIINEAGGKLVDLRGNKRKYNLDNTLIDFGIIAGDSIAVSKILPVVKTK
jgi:myo-inositol-1(or 4)-monophosphatase